MLHLYSISTPPGEESAALCPDHNNKVAQDDGSLRPVGRDYQLTQPAQQQQLLMGLRWLFKF